MEAELPALDLEVQVAEDKTATFTMLTVICGWRPTFCSSTSPKTRCRSAPIRNWSRARCEGPAARGRRGGRRGGVGRGARGCGRAGGAAAFFSGRRAADLLDIRPRSPKADQVRTSQDAVGLGTVSRSGALRGGASER